MNYRLAYQPIIKHWVLLRWDQDIQDSWHFPRHPHSNIIVQDLKLEKNWTVMFIDNEPDELLKIIYAQTNEPRQKKYA